MVTGFNTNIEYQGKVYHVQTECDGGKHVVISTFLFKDGAALLSRKTDYFLSGSLNSSDETIKGWIKEQHRKVLKELVGGTIPLPADRRPHIE
ncbi:MAG: hypothetical protein AAB317_00200 [Nitrospirota bacterium]